ncbi:MAG: sulfurtransferase TusA family protein [bacterium]
MLALSDKVSMKNDIPAFCRQSGNELLGLETSVEDSNLQKDAFAFYIKKR